MVCFFFHIGLGYKFLLYQCSVSDTHVYTWLKFIRTFQVLEMIGGRAGELQPGTPGGGPSQPPQMISMLLRSCDFQLTESCQQELSSKLGPEAKIKGPSEYTHIL